MDEKGLVPRGNIEFARLKDHLLAEPLAQTAPLINQIRDTGLQLLPYKRLGKVIVRPALKTRQLVLQTSSGSQQYDGDVARPYVIFELPAKVLP